VLPDPERRQLTVLFCDLVGSTTLSTHLDPEDLREILLKYQEESESVVKRYEGRVAQWLGDGFMAYFGNPRAHEDDAHRAVHTALGILEALRQLNVHLRAEKGVELAVRIGMHTGLAVVGAVGGGDRVEQLAVGETPNVAKRVQELAEPDTILLSASTYRLVRGYFAVREPESQIVKGLADPIDVYEVIGATGATSRMDVTPPSHLTPMVNRQAEMAQLTQLWEQALQGQGHAILLKGEPGIGKSRITQALKDGVVADNGFVLEGRCSPYYQSSAFYPVVDLVSRALGFHAEDSDEIRLRKLEDSLARHGLHAEHYLPLLCPLFSLPTPEGAVSVELAPAQRRQKTMEALIAWLRAAAGRAPVLLVFEDLHWSDPTTVALIGSILERIELTRVLVVVTFRPEFKPPWPKSQSETVLEIPRLSDDDTVRVAERAAGNKSLPPEVLREVIAKTEGVPLFVEELSKMVVESGVLREAADSYELAGTLGSIGIPSTVQGSLLARLDRLPTATRSVAQLGATLGRDFSFELIHVVSEKDQSTLELDLDRLVHAEVLFKDGPETDAVYAFKHALIQDAAYESLSYATRRQYHQRIARALEKHFPETVDSRPELAAHHFAEAGLTAVAVAYWLEAGTGSIKRGAFVEAIDQLRRGLELLRTLPPSESRDSEELRLRTALGPALINTRGYASPEVQENYQHARTLCDTVGDAARTFAVLRGEWAYHIVRALDQGAVERVAEELLALAEREQTGSLLLEAYRCYGFTQMFVGNWVTALDYLDRGLALYDADQHRGHAAIYGNDPAMVCLGQGALALAVLGYPDQALARCRRAVEQARSVPHAYSEVQAMALLAQTHVLRREPAEAVAAADFVIQRGSELGIHYWVAFVRVLRGWATAMLGHTAEGKAAMIEGLAAYASVQGGLILPWLWALLAEVNCLMKAPVEALTLLQDSLHRTEDTRGDRFAYAEVYRLLGEVRLMQDPGDRAGLGEDAFRTALDIARQQQTKLWELRAAAGLADLLRSQARCEEAYAVLAPVYEWYSEGENLTDLQRARDTLTAIEEHD
jgi:class 3 adenylate cyclase/predicted ATPase